MRGEDEAGGMYLLIIYPFLVSGVADQSILLMTGSHVAATYEK